MVEQETFETYMDNALPTWKTDLSDEAIMDIKSTYDDWKDWTKIAHDTIEKAFKSGIDHSTDLTRAQENIARMRHELNSKIAQYSNKGAVIEETSSKTM